MLKLFKILFGISKFSLLCLALATIVIISGSAILICVAITLASNYVLPVVGAFGAIWLVLLGLFMVSAQRLILLFINEIEEKSQASMKSDKPDNKE
ncbi:MAG: hypothetical protein HZA49_08930 [Planctomycetes bacterium]|nr:hypothetical protein [Planctomycetota bacterium]